ncbi:MAG TPA: hypothetical protein ENI16_00625, partial [Candidatus Portnoybacteria bacterium]|nr:hypothetical protein [Candidatus Portnoybacteria bacterium]
MKKTKKEKSSQTIYIEKDEEITSICERLGKNKAKEIAIVIPKGAVLFQSIVNLKLLGKEASKLEKKIFIITSDKFGQNLAAKADLAVRQKLELEESVETEPEEETKISVRPAGEKPSSGRVVRVSDIIKPSERPVEEVKRKVEIGRPPVEKKEEYPKLKPKKEKREVFLPAFSAKFFLIFVCLSLVIVALVTFSVLPTANITITPRT